MEQILAEWLHQLDFFHLNLVAHAYVRSTVPAPAPSQHVGNLQSA